MKATFTRANQRKGPKVRGVNYDKKAKRTARKAR